jgi:hypothetical protein
MTSGSMPPHTNGGKTFIHDPRMSNLPETKASIKLKFKTIKGREVKDKIYLLCIGVCNAKFLAFK